MLYANTLEYLPTTNELAIFASGQKEKAMALFAHRMEAKFQIPVSRGWVVLAFEFAYLTSDYLTERNRADASDNAIRLLAYREQRHNKFLS